MHVTGRLLSVLLDRTDVLLSLLLGALCIVVFCIISRPKYRKHAEHDDEMVNSEDKQNYSLPDPDNDENAEMIDYIHEMVKTNSEMIECSAEFYRIMLKRRSLRFFSSRQVDIRVIQNIVRTAGTAPSGANQQPWTFVVVSNAELKCRIREIVEAEEEINYKQRMGDKWVDDLRKLNTNWIKPYLETAPYLIVVLRQAYAIDPSTGNRQTHYYSEISVSIAAGLLISAIHMAGLVTLTSTPLNAGPAIRALLQRPANERVALLMPVGHPAEGAVVPAITRKKLDDIMVLFE